MKINSDKNQGIVVLSTSLTTQGGIAAVMRAYVRAGLFERWPVIHISTHRDGSAIAKLHTAVFGLVRYLHLLAIGKVRLVHVHAASDASFWRKSIFVWIALAARRRVIFHIHGGGFLDFYAKRCGAWRRAWVRFILNHVTDIVVLAENWRAEIGQITYNENIHVIANPVEANELIVIDRSCTQAPELLFMGRLVKEKGLFDLVDALVTLRPKHRGLRLLLAGEGVRAEIEQYAQMRGVRDMLWFGGWVEGRAKTMLWERAAIFVLPSYIEGLPTCVLEAMAAGLPVVATNVGGIPSLIEHAGSGLLISPGDISALANALDQLLSDARGRKRMGKKGRRLFVESFAPEQVIGQVEALYVRHGVSRLAPHPNGTVSCVVNSH